jgi:hypothetical protein
MICMRRPSPIMRFRRILYDWILFMNVVLCRSVNANSHLVLLLVRFVASPLHVFTFANKYIQTYNDVT